MPVLIEKATGANHRPVAFFMLPRGKIAIAAARWKETIDGKHNRSRGER